MYWQTFLVMNLKQTEQRLYKSWKIVRLINLLQDRLEEIREKIRSKGKNFYSTFLKYRDTMEVIKNRIEALRNAYMQINL